MKNRDLELAFYLSKAHYEQSKNILYVLGAFVLAWKEKVNPPDWIVELLATSFERYADLKGTVSLDAILGLRQQGKGKKPAHKQARNNQSLYFFMYEVHKLRKIFKLTVSEAVKMVCEVYRKEHGTHAGADIYLDEIHLTEVYSRQKWGKRLDQDLLFGWELDHCIDEEDKRQLLNKFPEHAIPARLRKY